MLVTAELAGTLAGLALETLDAARLPDLGATELLLLGTGEALRAPPAAFVEGACGRGWRVEAMDSAAAARTLNVLLAEDRLVGALIL